MRSSTDRLLPDRLAGPRLPVGSSEDAGCPLIGPRAVARAHRVPVHGPVHAWQAGSWSLC